MSDLSVTQLLIEEPEDSERGAINGVQNSLNQFLDMLKFILVVLLPWQQTFGFLILLSYLFIVLGAVSYINFACRASGKLKEHQEKREKSESQNASKEKTKENEVKV